MLLEYYRNDTSVRVFSDVNHKTQITVEIKKQHRIMVQVIIIMRTLTFRLSGVARRWLRFTTNNRNKITLIVK